MGVLINLLLLLCCLGCEVCANNSIKDYLDGILRQSKVEIAKAHIQEPPPVQAKSYKVQWDKLWEESLSKNRTFTVNIFDKIYILEGNRILSPSTDSTLSNETTLQEVAQIRYDKSVKFVRSIVWKATLYLLICYETSTCSLYTGSDNLQLKHRQSIQHRGFPMDASFFTRANRLYLVIAHNSGQFTVPSVIYHWRSTYMDVVREVLTTAAVSVTTFKYKQSTIIVFAQNDRAIPRIGSMVYEFRETSLDHIQFLSTFEPISVHHYNHESFDFILFVNEIGPSNLFWWDGQELLNWLQLSEIRAPSLIRIVNINGETFFFTARENVLQLYKVERTTDSTYLSRLNLKNEEIVMDMRVRIEGSMVILVLVIVNDNYFYGVKLWELNIKEVLHDGSKIETDLPSRCLSELIEILQRRMPIIEEAQSKWPSLLSATENVTISHPINLPDFILESGSVENINLLVDEEFSMLKKIAEDFDDLARDVDNTLSISKEISASNERNESWENIVVEGDAFFDELMIDSLRADFIDGVNINSKESLQRKSSLHGTDILMSNIEVDSLCGIPFQYWALRNETSKVILNIDDDKMEFVNNTVFFNSNVSLSAFNVKTLNDVDVEKFFSELFIINHNQRIEGNVTFKNTLRIGNLTLKNLNDEPVENFMTKNSDQKFHDFSMKTLYVDKLQAEVINGVPVSEAARISRENLIKGEVKVASLQVTEKLTVDVDLEFPEIQSLQIYSNVTIEGDIRAKTINFEKEAKMFLNNDEINLEEIFHSFWTKSTNQVIKNNMKFEADLIIDQLDVKYLNGLSKDDFLYTTAKEIPEKFGNLNFTNVYFNEPLVSKEENKSSFNITSQCTEILKEFHVKRLRADNLLIDTFNGVSIDDILNVKQPLIFSENTNFPAIRAKRVNVDELELLFVNGENIFTLLENKAVNSNFTVDSLQKKEFYIENLVVENINGLEMKKLNELKDLDEEDLQDLVIDGDLTVKNTLRVKQIDDQPVDIYLEKMSKENITITEEHILIDDLIVENLTLNLLHGRKVDNLFDNVFSRSKEQVVRGQFSFYKISADNADVRLINDEETSKFMWVDEPLTFMGDVTFEDLHVDGDVETMNLNGQDVNELYEELLHVPLKHINNLKVDGNVSWRTSSSDSNSLSYLFANAVTTDTNQVIHGDVTFETDVHVSIMNAELKEINEIRSIISDTVIDDEEVIEVSGKKTFKKELTVDTLSVTGDTIISMINDVNILEFNNSVVRKYQEEVVTGSITFLDEVTINELFINDSIHDAPISGLAVATDTLPDNITFKHLTVSQDVHLMNLDGVDFDKFVQKRITLSGNHDIWFDVQFNGVVEVTGNATVATINGINPSDLVLSGVNESQFITGEKIFTEDLHVDGQIFSPLINNRNISSEYSNGIQNDEDVEIFGDLIFESKVKISGNLSVSGLVNGMNLSSSLEDSKERTHWILRTLNQNENLVEESINSAAQISKNLRNIFWYLETELNLKIQAPNIAKVDVIYYEDTTKLNMFGEESGELCGLPSNCSCPLEYVAELAKEDCRVWRTNGSTIVRNFHESNSAFGINVITNGISSSGKCTSNNIENEFTTISWIKMGLTSSSEVITIVEEPSERIRGFLKDAQVFMHDDEAYVVLAIYYDPLRETHRTDSLVYRINFEKNELSLHQNLSTDGAWDIEIFKTNLQQDIYLVVGCFGNSSRSLLYKFDVAISKFVLQESFPGRSRYVKSISQEDDQFVLLEGHDTNSINIYRYNAENDSFDSYQSIFHDSPINGIERFYADEFGHSDSFVIVTTEDGQFYIYEYMFVQKFQLRVRHRTADVKTMVPFYYLDLPYVFTGTRTNSEILRIVQQSPRKNE